MKKGWKIACGTAIAGALAIVFAVLPARSPRGGPETRLAATPMFRTLLPEEIPEPIADESGEAHVRSLRRKAARGALTPHLAQAMQLIADASLKDAPDKEAPAMRLAPLLPQDGASPPGLFASIPSGDALDIEGRPLRWRLSPGLLAACGTPVPRPGVKSESAAEASPGLPLIPPSAKSAYYRGLVEDFARRYNLNSDLIMAIIHSESDFSPTLVSGKSAMGLMQLLPGTASDEVHRFLYGRRGSVSFEQLRVPEVNIRYGSAYLHILHNRYFGNVADSEVRETCVVAAYNLGPNRFLRLYGKNSEQAVAKINSMSPEEFHRDLASRLPARETRYFVKKVRGMKLRYAGSR